MKNQKNMSTSEYVRQETRRYFENAPPPKIVIIGFGFMQPDFSYRPGRKPAFFKKLVQKIRQWFS